MIVRPTGLTGLVVVWQGPGKKWESYDLNKNGKPLRVPMHVRKGDTVQIIAGKDKGKVGEVSVVSVWQTSGAPACFLRTILAAAS